MLSLTSAVFWFNQFTAMKQNFADVLDILKAVVNRNNELEKENNLLNAELQSTRQINQIQNQTIADLVAYNQDLQKQADNSKIHYHYNTTPLVLNPETIKAMKEKFRLYKMPILDFDSVTGEQYVGVNQDGDFVTESDVDNCGCDCRECNLGNRVTSENIRFLDNDGELTSKQEKPVFGFDSGRLNIKEFNKQTDFNCYVCYDDSDKCTCPLY